MRRSLSSFGTRKTRSTAPRALWRRRSDSLPRTLAFVLALGTTSAGDGLAQEAARITCEPLRSAVGGQPVDAEPQACFSYGSDGFSVDLFAEDASGNRVPIDQVELPLPFAELTYLRDRAGRDWLVASYYSDTPLPDGYGHFVTIYEGREKRLSSWSVERPGIEDLDGNGFVEVTLFPLVLDIRYVVKRGIPIVLELGDELTTRTMHEYPAVRERFVLDLRELIEHLNRTCATLRGGLGEAECDYAPDLALLHAQLEAASRSADR